LDESDLSLPGFGTGMTVDVCQLSGKLSVYQGIAVACSASIYSK